MTAAAPLRSATGATISTRTRPLTTPWRGCAPTRTNWIETEGYKGKEYNAGLLLNYSIGQYDTYSVMQLASYVNTIINEGERLKLNLVKEVKYATKDNSIGKTKSTYQKTVLNEKVSGSFIHSLG